ncbi:MAG TPA: DCC1-like thiol-disulfide oxidoreductase family protein [Polyangia bacterium]|jgi:predicted DCC family thiol-disulfide oxidoreductase YuxK
MALAEARGVAPPPSVPTVASSRDVIVLYDGVCGLCSRLISFLLPRDRHRRLRFAALQGRTAAAILSRHGVTPTAPGAAPQSVVLVELPDTPSERLYFRSDAALRIAHALPGAWPALALLLVLPRFLRDWGYDRVANSRYRIFGRLDACTLPSPENRARFLD